MNENEFSYNVAVSNFSKKTIGIAPLNSFLEISKEIKLDMEVNKTGTVPEKKLLFKRLF